MTDRMGDAPCFFQQGQVEQPGDLEKDKKSHSINSGDGRALKRYIGGGEKK
jgi:hypothetical protein